MPKKASKKKVTKKRGVQKVQTDPREIDPKLRAKVEEFGADLPDELLRQLSLRSSRMTGLGPKLVLLLPEKGEPPMDVNDLMIALFREHKIVPKRTQVVSAMHHEVSVTGNARRAGKGCYTKT